MADPLLEYVNQTAGTKQPVADTQPKKKDPLLEYAQQSAPAATAETEKPFLEQAGEVATNVVKAPVELAKYFIEPSSPEAGKSIKAEELQALSDKYKGAISPEELGRFAIGMGGSLENAKNPTIDKLIGIGLEGLAGGAVPFAVKKLKYADNPEARKAIDEVRSLVDERKTKGQVAAELATGLLVPGGVAAKGSSLAVRAAAPVLAGAAYGIGSSKEGTEVKSAIQGGLLGGYLHGLTAGATKLVKGASNALEKSREPKVSSEPKVSLEPKVIQETKISFTPEKADQLEQQIKEKLSQEDVASKYVNDAIDSKPVEVTPEDTKRLLESRPEDASEVMSELVKRSEQEIPQEALEKAAAQKLLNDEIGEFARYLEDSEVLGGKKYERPENAAEAIKRATEIEGPDFIRDSYERFKESKAAQQVFDEGLMEKMPESATNVKGVRDFLLNSRYAYRFMDRKLGTNLESTMDKLTNGMNLYSLKVDNVLDQIAKIGKELEAVKLNPNEVTAAIETGSWKNLPEPQKNAVMNVINYQESLRKQANELGLPIKQRDAYVRHSTVSAPEYISRMLQKADELKISMSDGMTQLEYERLLNKPEGREFVQALTLGKGAAPKNAAEINVLMKQSLDPQSVSERINNYAAAAQKREGEIPSFVRETDILKLMKNWGENTFRHAYLRKPLAEMKKYRNMAMSAGNNYAASYINTHLGQILGTKAGNKNLASWLKNQRIQFQAKMLKEANQAQGARKLVYEQLAAAPETVQFLMGQVYPNFLGLKAKSALVNLVQPLMLSVPEIGWTKGSGLLLKAYADLAQSKIGGKVIRLSPEMAQKLGKEPGSLIKTRDLGVILGNDGTLSAKSFNHEVERFIKDGINQTTKGLPRRAIDRLNQMAMFFFESSEEINRYVAKEMGAELAREAFKNGGKSQTLDKILPPSYKRELRGKTLEEAQRLIGQYMVNKTMFAYNKAELSKFGRDFGSLMSQFSKFPSSISGDLIDIMQSRGALKGGTEVLRKYLAPVFALGVVGSLGLNQMIQENPALKKLVGSQGVEDWAALGAIKSVLDRGFAPPHVKNVMGTLQAGIEGSPQKGWKMFNDVVQSTMPLGWTLRFLGDDLPAYRGTEPEKGSFLQKALRGAGVDENNLDSYVDELEQAKRGRN